MLRREEGGLVQAACATSLEMDLAFLLQGARDGPALSPSLLDFAANDELAAFRYAAREEGRDIGALYTWYGKRDGGQLLVDQRTPAMVAAENGCVNVLSYILSSSPIDVNRRSRMDGMTALHFCAAGGSQRAAETCSLLLKAGADRCIEDLACRRRPGEMIYNKIPQVKASLQRQLLSPVPIREWTGTPSVAVNIPSSPLARVRGGSASAYHELFGPDLVSGVSGDRGSPPVPGPHEPRRDHRGFVLDPTIPDVTSSLYMSDDFRMFSFKIKPCSRSYSHDWTECPFAHPGEAARRRDPRQHPYSCLPCTDFRKGVCAKGDTCDFAHGVFESWLHPAQYRTRLCKDGPACDRRVCFFAHLPEELRPTSSNWGDALPLSYTSPMSPSPLETHSYAQQRKYSPPLPVSPSSVLLKQGPFSPGPGSPVAKQPSPPQAFLSPPRSPGESPDHSRGFVGSALRPQQMLRPKRLSAEFRREYEQGGYEDPMMMSPRVSRPMSPYDVSREVLLAEEARVRRLGDAYEAGRLAAELGSFHLGRERARSMAAHQSPRFRPFAQSSVGPLSPPLGSQGDDFMARGYDRPPSPQLAQVRNPRSPLGGAIGLPAVQGGGYGRSAGVFAPPRSGLQHDVGQSDSQRLAHSRFARSATWQGQVSEWGSPGGVPDWGIRREEVHMEKGNAEPQGAGEPDISWVQKVFEDDVPAEAQMPDLDTRRYGRFGG